MKRRRSRHAPRSKRPKTLESDGGSSGNSDSDSEEAGPDRWELSTTIDDDQGVLDLIAEYQRGEEAGYPEPDPALERVLVRAVGERSVPLVAGCFGDTSAAEARQNEFMLTVGRALFAGVPSRPSPGQAVLCGRLIRALLPPVLQAPASAAFTEGVVQDAECSFSRARGKLPAALLPDLIAAATSSPFLSVARQRALITLAVQAAEAVRATGASDLPARLAVACAEAPLNVAAAARSSSAFMGSAPTTFQPRAPACAAEWYVASGRILYFVLAQGAKAAERKDSVVRALSRAFAARPVLADSAAACLCQASFAASSSSSSSSSSSAASPFVLADGLDESEAEDVADDPAALAAFLFCATAHMGMGGPRLSAERVLARVLTRLPGKKPALVAAGTAAAFSPRAFALLLALADRLCSAGSGALAVALLRHAATTATGADEGKGERVPGLKLRAFLSVLRYAGLGVEPFPAVCAALEALSQQQRQQYRAILGDEASGDGDGEAAAAEIEGALHECLRDRAPALSASSCYALVSSVTPLLGSAPVLLSAALEDIYALETEHFEHGVAGICALLGNAPGPHAPALVSELASCWSATKGDSACVAFFLKHLASVVPSILEVAAVDPQAALFVDEILGQFLLVCRAREATNGSDGDGGDGFYWVLDYAFLRSQTPCFVGLLWCCCSAVLALEGDGARACRSGIENYSRVADILGSICRDLGRGAASDGLRDMVAALGEDPTIAAALSLVATLLAAFAWSRAGARSSSVPPALPILDAAAAFSVKAAEVYAALTRADLAADGAGGGAEVPPGDLAAALIPPGTELSALPASAVSLVVSLAYEVLLGSSKDRHGLEKDDGFFAKNCTYLTVARCLELASRWGEPYLNLKNLCLVSWSTFTRASAHSAPTSAPAFNDVHMLVLQREKQQQQQQQRKDAAGLVRSLQVAALGAIADIINTHGQLFANLSRAVSLLAGIVESLCADVADRSKASRRAKCEINVSLLQAYSAVLQALCKVIPGRARTPALLRLWAVLDPLSADPAKKLSPSITAAEPTRQGSKAPPLAISTSLVVVQLLLDYLPKKESVAAVKALIGHCVPEFAAQRRGALFSSWCIDAEEEKEDGEKGGNCGKAKAKAPRAAKAVKPLQEISIAPWSKAFSYQVISKCLSTLIRFVPQDDAEDNNSLPLPLLLMALGSGGGGGGAAAESEAQTFLGICSVASYFIEVKTSAWDSRIESRVTSLAARLLSVMERHLAALCKEIEEINSVLSVNNTPPPPPPSGSDGAKAGLGREKGRGEVDVEQIEKVRAEIGRRAEGVAHFIPHFKAFASLTVEHNSKFRSGTEEQNLAKKINDEIAVISGFLDRGKDVKVEEDDVGRVNEGSEENKEDGKGEKEKKAQKPTRSKRLKQQRSKRSRNAFIDANLTTGMDDTYADLEDFIVCAPNTQYQAQETERELNSKTIKRGAKRGNERKEKRKR